MIIKGNTIFIRIEAGADSTIILPAGYSYEKVHFTNVVNVWGLFQTHIYADSIFTFPPINSKSPNYFRFNISDKNKESEIRLVIEKFGQIPDDRYFDKAFDPILVTGDDGKKYNVIPSDQFK